MRVREPRHVLRCALFGAALTLCAASSSAQGAATEPGTVVSHKFIAEGKAGFTAELLPYDSFGHAVAGLGDMDGDSIGDIIVGCPNFLPEPIYRGRSFSSLYVLYLNADGSVKMHTKIGDETGGFTGDLAPHGQFGASIAALGDTDFDGVMDIAVGEQSANGLAGFPGVGAVWLMHLRPNGTVKGPPRKITMGESNFFFPLSHGDNFGVSIAALGDLDGNGMVDIAVGANGDDGPAVGVKHANFGAVYILFLEPSGLVMHAEKIGMGFGGFPAPLMPGDFFGTSLAAIPDVDGNGVAELLVGAPGDDDGGSNRGAVWKLAIGPDALVTGVDKISSTSGSLPSALADHDSFGRAISPVGDLDDNGAQQFVVSSPGQDLSGDNNGSVHTLFLDPLGVIDEEQVINEFEGDFTPNVGEPSLRATALGVVTDVNGDGADELAVGSIPPTPAGADRGGVYLLMLNATVSTPLDASSGGGCGERVQGRLRITQEFGGVSKLSLSGVRRALPAGARPVLFVGAGAPALDPCTSALPDLQAGAFVVGRPYSDLGVELPRVVSLVGQAHAMVGAYLADDRAGSTNSIRLSLRF